MFCSIWIDIQIKKKSQFFEFYYVFFIFSRKNREQNFEKPSFFGGWNVRERNVQGRGVLNTRLFQGWNIHGRKEVAMHTMESNCTRT